MEADTAKIDEFMMAAHITHWGAVCDDAKRATTELCAVAGAMTVVVKEGVRSGRETGRQRSRPFVKATQRLAAATFFSSHSVALRNPIEAGRVFRGEAGHHSEMKPDSVPK
jgi:hypothetical protein